jgi:hypothetical protein
MVLLPGAILFSIARFRSNEVALLFSRHSAGLCPRRKGNYGPRPVLRQGARVSRRSKVKAGTLDGDGAPWRCP